MEWKYVEELKRRLFISLGCVAFFSFAVFAFVIRKTASGWYYPAPSLADSLVSQIFSHSIAFLLPSSVKLVVMSPLDAFVGQLAIALFLGIALGLPVFLYQMMQFILPALYPKERKILFRYFFPLIALFVLGILFSYFFVAPLTLGILYSYATSINAEQFITVSSLFSFLFMLALSFGIVFLTPMIMIALTSSGFVPAVFWKEKWKQVVFAVVVFSAIVTPDGTGITMGLIAVPMMILYFVGYLICKTVESHTPATI